MSIDDMLQSIKLELEELDARRTQLIDYLENIQAKANQEAEQRRVLKEAGFTEEATEAAIAVQYGKKQPDEAKPAPARTVARSDKDTASVVKAQLGDEWRSNRDLQDSTGIDKVRIHRALNMLISAGEVEKMGNLNGTKYRLLRS